jgi:hypothetical protein
MRNDLMFDKQGWPDVRGILRKILRLTLEWKCIFKETEMGKLMKWCSILEQKIKEPLRIRNA